VLRDSRDAVTVSTFNAQLGCCVSLPVVLGRGGVVARLRASLDGAERLALHQSVKRLRAAAGQ
jgi:L-lactate dehydrogenase